MPGVGNMTGDTRSRARSKRWRLNISVLRCTLAIASLLALAISTHADEPNKLGQQIYQKQCIRCHGPQGEGVKNKYAAPLEGDKSVNQLSKQIARTMPEDAPESLKPEEADAVAKYIHDAFYSRVARERNRPARIDLSRLTVKQLRLAVADVVDYKQPTGWWGDKRGLNADYFAAKHWRNDKKVLNRLDAGVDFDFGTKSPVPGKTEDYEFYIHWSGSVLPAETGWYDFIIKSNQAVKLHVNNHEKPLIDAMVKSGNDTEYKAGIYLVAGKAYPIKLEFSKAKQGVDDKKEKKAAAPPQPAFITLMWKPPTGIAHPIPSTHLATDWFPQSYVVSNSFPPDDRSYGWERGSTVSKAWDAAATDAALDAATYVVSNLDRLANIKAGDKERDKKVKDYCAGLVERAFRRPLTDEQKQRYIEMPFTKAKNTDEAVKMVVVKALKAPQFLYREVGEQNDDYAVASRLSFALWDTLPDQELLKAAKEGKLKTLEQVKQQGWRMLNRPYARAKVNEFIRNWLKLDRVTDLAKDPKRFPGFDAQLIHDLRTSLDLFLADVVWSERAYFKDLLLSEEVYYNDRLARFYGYDHQDKSFTKVKLNTEKRAGVLTHPYLMSSFAYVGETSPIHRGVFLARGILGLLLRPPAEAVTPIAPELHPAMSTRERVSLQTKPQACMSCHQIINPLGFTMEQYDAVGRFRAKEKEKPIDASGYYQTRSGEVVNFNGVCDLAQFLADSPEVHEAFTEQMFQHLIKQPIRAYGLSKRQEMTKHFTDNGFNIRHLVVQISADAALRGRDSSMQAKK